jgi:hypothetical protein
VTNPASPEKFPCYANKFKSWLKQKPRRALNPTASRHAAETGTARSWLEPRAMRGEQKTNMITLLPVDEGRKRVLGIMAAILASLHMQTADDLFGGPQGSPRSDKLIAASVQWAEKIMEKIDSVFSSSDLS